MEGTMIKGSNEHLDSIEARLAKLEGTQSEHGRHLKELNEAVGHALDASRAVRSTLIQPGQTHSVLPS